MSDFKVDFGALSTASADIGSCAAQLEHILDTMDQTLQPLRANWTGEAAAAYEQAKAKWTAAITDMKDLLRKVGTTVGNTNQDYQSTERGNAARFGG